MIEFVTLYLGLVLGLQPVEVAVSSEVASVELLLDSKSIGVMRGAPWQMTGDFGRRLLPHRLEAVARDSDGREIGRAEQWLNLPRQRAEVTLSLHSDQPDGPGWVQLIWDSLTSARQSAVRVLLDGEPLPRTNKVTLPTYLAFRSSCARSIQ